MSNAGNGFSEHEIVTANESNHGEGTTSELAQTPFGRGARWRTTTTATKARSRRRPLAECRVVREANRDVPGH